MNNENNTQTNEVNDNNEKRTRISPRAKVLDAVYAEIAKMHQEWAEDKGEQSETALRVLDALSTRLEGLDRPEKPVYVGRHFIGVKEDGSRTPFTANYPPSKKSHGLGTVSNFTSVFGPIKTKNEMITLLANPNSEMPVLF